VIFIDANKLRSLLLDLDGLNNADWDTGGPAAAGEPGEPNPPLRVLNQSARINLLQNPKAINIKFGTVR